MRPNIPRRPDKDLMESLLAVERMRTIERVGGDPGYLQPYWEWTSRIAAGLVLAGCLYAGDRDGPHSRRGLTLLVFALGIVVFPNALARFATQSAAKTRRVVTLLIFGWVTLLYCAWPYLRQLV